MPFHESRLAMAFKAVDDLDTIGVAAVRILRVATRMHFKWPHSNKTIQVTAMDMTIDAE